MSKVALGEICEILNGYAFKSDKYVDSGVRVIRITNVQKGYVEDEKPQFYSEEDMQNLQEYLLTEGDLLMSLTGNVGRVALLGKEFLPAALNQRVSCLRNKSNKVNMKYVYYALLTQKFEDDCIASAKGIAQKNMSTEWLKQYTIELPEVDKQEEIVQICDKLSTIVEERRQQLLELDNLIKSRFVELFGDMLLNPMGWKEKRLDTIADIVSGITKGRKVKTTELIEVPYMAVSNVKDGYIDWTTVKTIMATQAEIEQYRLLPYDVLMTEGGDPDKLGRGAIIHEPPINCIHQNHIFRVRLNQTQIIPAFMEQYLKQQKAKRYFLGCAKQTTGIASINMTQLKALPVLVPPIELQMEYKLFVEQSDKSKVVIQKFIEKCRKEQKECTN